MLELLHRYYLHAKQLRYPSERRMAFHFGIRRRAYTFGFPYMIISRPPENLEHDRLAVVPTLPNFGLLIDVSGTVALLRDTLKLIRCRDRTMVSTQPPKLNSHFPLFLWLLVPTRKLLRRKCDESEMGR